ncbi:MAG TPA: phosphate acyltransferase PlsX [Planctomycetaceae bacterium]|jgi:glycerol-3-phosphate acyltransferase PlsX|nr:phosphate acyltransferase PlsX [Planctomycetaceae bacterium]
MRIALDAMGGDFAPGPNVHGAIAAVQENPGLEVLLVGEQAELERLLAETGYSGKQIVVIPSEGVAGMDEKPMEALLKKPNCSIAVCWKLMAGREADAVVSAGSTGAVVGAGLRTRLFLKGVRRPGIGVVLPTMAGRTVLLDVGANPGAKPEHLAQYAVMGDIYAREVVGVETPRIGLMNIGSEEGKGTDTVRDTHKLISDSPVRERYLGNVEGRDLFQGAADVIVCEGFVGNVVLKASEGMAEMMLKGLSQEVLEHVDQEKHLVGRAFEKVGRRFSYHESGGAPLLGVDGVCMICHGSSNERSILNALRRAVEIHDRQINSQIIEAIAQMPMG